LYVAGSHWVKGAIAATAQQTFVSVPSSRNNIADRPACRATRGMTVRADLVCAKVLALFTSIGAAGAAVIAQMF
jgi:hypothetical protein